MPPAGGPAHPSTLQKPPSKLNRSAALHVKAVHINTQAHRWTCLQAANHVSSHTVESLRANAAAVASATLEHLLQHLRRGKAQVLWERMLVETHARVATCLVSGMYACLGDCVRFLCQQLSQAALP